MRKKRFVLLIPGILFTMLMPSASALEGSAPSYNQWRPLADRSMAAEWAGRHQGPVQSMSTAPWKGVQRNPNLDGQAYRFRSWGDGKTQRARVSMHATPGSNYAAYQNRQSVKIAQEARFQMPSYGYQQPQPAVYPKHLNWRPVSAAPGTAPAAYGVDNRYRFRPMQRTDKRTAPARWTYRPLQIDIPNTYVYRPLRVNKPANRVDRHIPAPPTMPQVSGYGSGNKDPYAYGFGYLGAPAQSLPSSDYQPRQQPVNYHNYRSAGSVAGHPGFNTHAWGYRFPRDRYSPRYAINMPFNSYRFRPLRRPGGERYRHRGPQPPRYAINPPVYPSTFSPLPPTHVYAYRSWMPPLGYPHPGMEQALRQPVATNRFGTNWYDGEADGEGAWYKLAGELEWPRVSHFSPVE
ncbi:MAG: hypothetical protein AB2598_18330 [Candidatus Thiodiazotropha sp.]